MQSPLFTSKTNPEKAQPLTAEEIQEKIMKAKADLKTAITVQQKSAARTSILYWCKKMERVIG